jgi:uncharacterized protein (DUF433 family)
MNWSGCDLVEVIPGKVSGEPLFKGTRLPASTILENVDAYMDEGLSLDQAIAATLESFPSVPNGAEGIRAILSHRARLA